MANPILDELVPISEAGITTDSAYIDYTTTEIATCAAVRAHAIVTAGTILTAGKRWKWNSTSTATDDETEAATAIQHTGTTTGRYLPVQSDATLLVHLPSGSTVAASGIDASNFPGVDVTAGVLSIGRGGQSASATALSTDASMAVLAQTLTGLGASKVYVARIGLRVTIWKDATKAHCGNLDCVIDAHVATDGAGVATATFATTPYFDTSLLIGGLDGASATVAASTGGFTVSATRKAGIACSASAAWWCVTLRDIT